MPNHWTNRWPQWEEGHDYTCSTLPSPRQTRALIRYGSAGRNTLCFGQCDFRVAWPAGNVPVSRPA